LGVFQSATTFKKAIVHSEFKQVFGNVAENTSALKAFEPQHRVFGKKSITWLAKNKAATKEY
jgi:hypothetical protein